MPTFLAPFDQQAAVVVDLVRAVLMDGKVSFDAFEVGTECLG